jgi:hypothetical protein
MTGTGSLSDQRYSSFVNTPPTNQPRVLTKVDPIS